jgi:anti-sigma factor RsiW
VDCARVDEELIGFQLAALDGATRAAVEAHLTGCARCVSSFLALKRAMDASEDALAPSQMTRARIRAEAAKLTATNAPRPRARRATWALAATAAAALIVAPIVYVATRAHAPRSARGFPPAATDNTVDTARTTPENLAFL